ncbi:MAG: hypothetical protein R3E64_09405 [Halioglobus sp.]
MVATHIASQSTRMQKTAQVIRWLGRDALLRAAIYFASVFAVGFALGTIRVLWLVPLVGERSAELLEMPLMLIAIFYSARFVTRRFPALRQSDLVISGALALIILIGIEYSIILGIRALSVSQYLQEKDPIAGAVYFVMLIVFATMPWVVGRKHVAT